MTFEHLKKDTGEVRELGQLVKGPSKNCSLFPAPRGHKKRTGSYKLS